MKAARFVLLVLSMAVLMACSCTDTGIGPEAERAAEKVTVETAVKALIQENDLTYLSKYANGMPTGAPVRTYEVGGATNDMASFPSAVWHIYHDGKEGYIRLRMMQYYYTVENDGTVRQFADAAKTVEYGAGN